MTADNAYGVSEIVGSSRLHDDAIRQAIAKAREDRRQMRWFEVTEIRGHIDAGQVDHFQVTLKLGYSLETETGRCPPANSRDVSWAGGLLLSGEGGGENRGTSGAWRRLDPTPAVQA